MKKIIKTSVLFFGVCFFAIKSNAQLASEKPALTAEQVANIIKAKEAALKTTTPASTSAVTKTTEINRSAQKSNLSIGIPNQGGVNPENKLVVSEIRTPRVPLQIEIPVEKPIEKQVEKPVKSKE